LSHGGDLHDAGDDRNAVASESSANYATKAVTATHIRQAETADAPALLAIYAPFVLHTAVSFEATPPTVAEFEARIRKALDRWTWLVAVIDGSCVGYAYGSTHRERDAYRFSVETSVYVDARFHRHGIARDLYQALLADLARRGYCNAYAGVALPNDASVALHRHLGFEPIGVFRAVGYKLDRWHDVWWCQRSLAQA
jgi:phosphinothricin acetyltransferase